MQRGPKTSSFVRESGYHQWEETQVEDGIGLESLFEGSTIARCAVRRQVLHWRTRKPSVLPSDLPRTHRERKELPILSHCGGRRGSGVSSLPAVPARMLPG